MGSHFSKPKSLQEQLAAERQRHSGSSADLAGPPPGEARWLNVGKKIKGDLLPSHLGLRYQRGWLYMAEDLLDQHLFLLGATGAGKSETIKRLVEEILSHTNRHIYFVDGKGDEGLAGDIRSLAYHHQRGISPVFKLGFGESGAIYDGFRGHASDIYNRLLALTGVTEMEGDSRYYGDIIRSILQYVCHMPQGPPRSFEDVLARVNRRALLSAYRGDKQRLARISHLKEDDFQGLYYRLIPLVEAFEACVGAGGFALEDVGCAIFSMRVQSVGDTAQRFLDFLVEDLKDFVGKRQTHPAVLIIDEFGQFSNDKIISLLTLARSSRLGIILATQDTSSLKDENTRQQVLANTRTKLLMGTEKPQEVAELAGTVYQIESSIQHEDGDITGKGSARVQHAYKVDMNEAGMQQAGEAFVIRQRHTAKVKVQRIGAVEQIAPQAPQQRQPPAEEPAEAPAEPAPEEQQDRPLRL